MRRCTLAGLSLSLLAHAAMGWWAWRVIEPATAAPRPALVLDLASIQVARPAPTVVPEPQPEPQPEPEPPPIPRPVPHAELPKPKIETRRKPRHKPRPPRRHPVRHAKPRRQPPLAPVAPPTVSAPAVAVASAVASAAPAVDVDRLRARYKAALLAALRKHKFYPRRALRRGREGTVKVGFTITADGRIENIHLAQGSGVRSLDKAALSVPAALGRFEPLPEGLGKQRWSLIVPLSYRLR